MALDRLMEHAPRVFIRFGPCGSLRMSILSARSLSASGYHRQHAKSRRGGSVTLKAIMGRSDRPLIILSVITEAAI